MYKSKYSIIKETKQQLKKRIIRYIEKHSLRRCSALRRKVRMDKYIDANNFRIDAKIRYSAFFSGIDILQKSKKYTKKIIDGYVCFEITGYAKNNEIVTLHLREESIDKDKILFLISTFYKK